MGVRAQGLDIKAGAAKLKADRAARLGRARHRPLESAPGYGPRYAVVADYPRRAVAGTPWLDVFCPGCGTSRAIDLRTVDRHPLASVGTMVLGLRCSWCPGSAQMPKLLGLYALPPARSATAAK
jgi:hypothetical protein